MERVESGTSRTLRPRALAELTTRLLADRWLLAIVVAVALRLVLAIVLRTTQIVERNGWYWANDDQVQYYGFGHALLHGDVADIYTFMGYGVLLAPLAVGTSFVLQVVTLVAVVQFLLAIPAAVWLYRAGLRLMDRRSAALGTILWLTTPFWLGAIWTSSYSEPFSASTIWLGLQIAVDYVSGLIAIGVLLLTAGARFDPSGRRGVLIGIVAGLGFLTKPSNVVLLASALAALAVWRRWRAAVFAAAAAAVVFVPQLVLNWALDGDPIDFSYSEAWPYGDDKALAAISYVPRTFGKLVVSNYTGPLILAGAIAALVVTWRRFPAARWLVVGQVAGFAVFFSPLYYSISGYLVRFLTPALPALCLAIAAAIVGRPSEQVGDTRVRPPGVLGLSVAGATLAGAAALAVFVAVAAVTPVLPEVSALAPRAEVQGGSVVLSWDAPQAPARLGYQLTRWRRPGEEPTLVLGGTATSATDKPGPGSWWYRVAITPGSDPSGWPPRVPLGVSRPVLVKVPAEG